MRIDFADLKTKVNITQVLELLSIRGLTEQGETLRGKCPLCESTNQRGFVITPSKGTFYCFNEKAGGDMIRLTARKLQASDRDGAEHIAKHLLNGAGKADDNTPPKPEAASPSSKSSGFDPLTYLQSLDAEHDALGKLELLPETLIDAQAGYSSKGLLRGRLAVAWHDVAGTIKFFIGVSLSGDLPLYLVPKDVQLPFWYGCNRVEEGSQLHILPTLLDVLCARQNGMENCIAPLRPVDADALTCLQALVATKKLMVEF